jgi:hypothetical protein
MYITGGVVWFIFSSTRVLYFTTGSSEHTVLLQEVGGADWNVVKPQVDSSEALKIRAVMILLAKEGGVSEETARLVKSTDKQNQFMRKATKSNKI